VSHSRNRQERWLHTRISENLEDALKREARRRRLPVSLLVRNVLEGALDLVEDIVENGLEVARRSQRLARHVSRSRDGGDSVSVGAGLRPARGAGAAVRNYGDVSLEGFLSRMGEDQGEGDSMMPKATFSSPSS
jgi:hypothetical protein